MHVFVNNSADVLGASSMFDVSGMDDNGYVEFDVICFGDGGGVWRIRD